MCEAKCFSNHILSYTQEGYALTGILVHVCVYTEYRVEGYKGQSGF